MARRAAILKAGILLVGFVGLSCSQAPTPAADGDASTAAQTEGGDDSMGVASISGGAGTTALDGGTTTASSTTSATDDGADSSGGVSLPPGCGAGTLRVAAYNTHSVEGQGTAGFEALAEVVRRVDADVICLEEVLYDETDDLVALAEQTGYAHVIQASEPPAIGGEFTNACMSRPPMRFVGAYTGWDLSPDINANDVGREILVVQVDLSQQGEAPCRVGLVDLHLKSGITEQDWFRRQVEVERVAQAVALYRADFPDEPLVVMGDLNENLDDPALGTVFNGIPAGLPASYEVGNDIQFPLTYQPFDRFAALGFAMADATQEDSTADETWSDQLRLDYVLYAGVELAGAEVYYACRDNGIDDAPPGNWLPKAGDPLPCSASTTASDHFPVFADLVLP